MVDPRPLTYCPHCKDHTSTQDIMYRMSINLMQQYPELCTACGKDKKAKNTYTK